MKNKIALIVILLLAVAQLIQPEVKEVKEYDADQDFLAIHDTEIGEDLKVIIKNTCYDCHSVKVNRPWYSKVSPVSWWIEDHIEEGAEHLNFSAWGLYPSGKRAHKLEECYEEIEEGEMPLLSYRVMHSDARFSDEEKSKLIALFKQLEQKERASSEE